MSASMFDPYAPDTKAPPKEVPLQPQQLVEYIIPGENLDQAQAQPHFQLETEAHNQDQPHQQDVKFSSEENLSNSPNNAQDGEDPKLKGRKKYRSSRSVDSSASSRSSASGYSRGNSPLDDPTFAPPPDNPVKSQHGSRGSVPMSHLPSFDMVTHSGNAMARISLKSLVIKKWKPIFWICYGDYRIIVFRSKSDFEEWLTNPHLGVVQREALVKCDINFKDISTKPGVKGYRAASLHLKDYGGKTGLMHTFKLEEWMYYGPIILGAFASKSRTDVHSFLVVLREITKRYRQNLSGNSYSAAAGHYDSDRSQFSTRSAPQSGNRSYVQVSPGSVRSGDNNRTSNSTAYYR